MARAFREDEVAAIRAALLESARRALARGGLRRVPVAALCRDAGISKGAFYRFFPSKEDIVIALLQEAETALRQRLLAIAEEPGPQRLRQILSVLFTAVQGHPLLGVLADPEEFAWLVRGLPPETLAAALGDDDRFFVALVQRLQAEEVVDPNLDPLVFAGLAPAALALAQQSELIGPHRAGAVTALIVDGLTLACAPRDRRFDR